MTPWRLKKIKELAKNWDSREEARVIFELAEGLGDLRKEIKGLNGEIQRLRDRQEELLDIECLPYEHCSVHCP